MNTNKKLPNPMRFALHWYKKARAYQQALEIYADSNHPYWVEYKETTKEGVNIYKIKDIKKLETLAKETLLNNSKGPP